MAKKSETQLFIDKEKERLNNEISHRLNQLAALADLEQSHKQSKRKPGQLHCIEAITVQKIPESKEEQLYPGETHSSF